MLKWFYLLKNLSGTLEHSLKKKDRGTLILLYKIAIHSEVLRSVNVLKIVTRFWTEKSKYRLNEWQISRLQEYLLGYTKLYLKDDDKIILLNQCMSTLASQLNSTKNLKS